MTTKSSVKILAATLLAASTWLPDPTIAQDATAPAAAAAPAPAAPAAPAFSQEQLDQMLAPIALYPDSLVMQIIMASTYPLEVVEADRWRGKNATLEGDALKTAVEAEGWDPSVQALIAFPDLLGRMSENLDWTQDLGDAFLSQQDAVLDTVQALRKQAYDAGNLKSGEQQTVTVEQSTQVIQIEPAQPEVVYVPQYNSAAVYGTPPPAQPYYPTANTYTGTDMLMTGALSFGAGLLIGNLISDDDDWDCDWDDHYVYGGGGHNDVDINIDGDVTIGNSVNVGSGNRQPWQHNPSHRRGVQYRDPKTRQSFANTPGARPALDRNSALGNSRGTLGSGGGLGQGSASLAQQNKPSTKLGSGVGAKAPSVAKKPAIPSKVASAAKKPAVAAKRPTSAIGSAGGNRPTAVGGLGGGSATRAASARGASSRGVSKSPPKLGGGGSKGGGNLGGGKRR
jgi:hypothetical protein